MFEHFQPDKQEQYQIEEGDFTELAEIVVELTDLGEYDPEKAPNRDDMETTMRGLALMCFRAGRSFQSEVQDTKYVTVHLKPESAGRWIDRLLEEMD